MTPPLDEKAKKIEWYRSIGYKHPLSHGIPRELVSNIIWHYSESLMINLYAAYDSIDMEAWGLPTKKDKETLSGFVTHQHRKIRATIARLSDKVGEEKALACILGTIKPLLSEEATTEHLAVVLAHDGEGIPEYYDEIAAALVWWDGGVRYNGDVAFANQVNMLTSGAFVCVQGLHHGDRCSDFLEENHDIIIEWLDKLLKSSPTTNWADYAYQHFPPMRELNIDYQEVPLVLIENDRDNPCYEEVAVGMVRAIAWVVACGYTVHRIITPSD